MSGKLIVLNGTEKSEAPLVVSGDKLEARGVTIAKGAKVVAAINTADQKAITVRFTVCSAQRAGSRSGGGAAAIPPTAGESRSAPTPCRPTGWRRVKRRPVHEFDRPAE